jgi:hypothetical protein
MKLIRRIKCWIGDVHEALSKRNHEDLLRLTQSYNTNDISGVRLCRQSHHRSDLYKPKPVSYQKVVEVLETEAIQVTRWPQSVVCAQDRTG